METKETNLDILIEAKLVKSRIRMILKRKGLGKLKPILIKIRKQINKGIRNVDIIMLGDAMIKYNSVMLAIARALEKKAIRMEDKKDNELYGTLQTPPHGYNNYGVEPF